MKSASKGNNVVYLNSNLFCRVSKYHESQLGHASSGMLKLSLVEFEEIYRIAMETGGSPIPCEDIFGDGAECVSI